MLLQGVPITKASCINNILIKLIFPLLSVSMKQELKMIHLSIRINTWFQRKPYNLIIEFHKFPTIAFQLIIHVSRKKKLENWLNKNKIVPKFHFL